MKTKLFSASLILFVIGLCAAENPIGQFQPPKVAAPKIPRARVSIKDFGAVSDGKTLNTEAIAKAIAAVSAKGGGQVVIPPGLWLTGPIGLKSKIDLHLEEGALVLFTTDLSQYPSNEINLKGEKFTVTTSPLHGENLQNVAITGKGVVDGSGQAWRPVKKSKMTERQWKELLASGGVMQTNGESTWFPSVAAQKGHRPVLMKLVNCRNVLLDGATFQNSPGWNLNPVLCEQVTIRNVIVRNPWYSQNGDGLDLEHCRDVIVRDSWFDVGDDAICLKSGMNERGRRIGVPTENVLVENCVVYHGHGGFTIGSEMSSGVRNVRVNNCVFMGTDLGLRFKSTRGRGGVVEKIFISNIRMTDIATDAIGFNMYYGGQSPTDEEGGDVESKAVPVSEGTPQFRDIYIQDVICRGARQAIALQGLPEMPIRGIHLSNVVIQAETGASCVDAAEVTFDRVEILNQGGPVLNVVNSRDVRIDRLSYAPGAASVIKARGANNSGIIIKNTELRTAAKDFDLSNGATREAFRVE